MKKTTIINRIIGLIALVIGVYAHFKDAGEITTWACIIIGAFYLKDNE